MNRIIPILISGYATLAVSTVIFIIYYNCYMTQFTVPESKQQVAIYNNCPGGTLYGSGYISTIMFFLMFISVPLSSAIALYIHIRDKNYKKYKLLYYYDPIDAE